MGILCIAITHHYCVNLPTTFQRCTPFFLKLQFTPCHTPSHPPFPRQGVTRPMFLSAAVGTALMPLYLWLFIIRLQWGVKGAACAYSAAIMSIAIVNIMVVMWREASLKRSGAPARCFHGWTWSAFDKIRSYLQYAIPSYFMCVCIEDDALTGHRMACLNPFFSGFLQSGGCLRCAWY